MFYFHVRVHIATQLQVPSAFSSCVSCVCSLKIFLVSFRNAFSRCLFSGLLFTFSLAEFHLV